MPEALTSTRLILFAGGMIFFLALELLLPYRKSTVSKARRWANNLGLTFVNAVFLYLVFASISLKIAAYVTQNEMGVMNVINLPLWVELVATVVFLDFMLYVWHLLNHEVPFLWRFHRVHHSDVNMDVSTATRFHIGELAISAVLKMALVFFIGATVEAVVLFEILIVLCAQFHHSSVKVPAWLEAVLWIFFVPPSMHRIHHSVIIRERNSNYGTILSLWDRLLETMVTRIDQRRIRIGVGAYNEPNKLGLPHLLIMPFTRAVR